MPITVCRLSDARADGNSVVLLLEIAGAPVSDTSLVCNNCNSWYRGAMASHMVALWIHSESSGAAPRIEDASDGFGVGATVEGASQEDVPHIERLMSRSAVCLAERSELYRRARPDRLRPQRAAVYRQAGPL